MCFKIVSCSHSTQDLGNIVEEPEVRDDWGKTVSSENTVATTLMSSQDHKIKVATVQHSWKRNTNPRPQPRSQ